jgi:hypothetical protein
VLETESSPTRPDEYIGSVTYNINLVVTAPDEGDDGHRDVLEEEEALGGEGGGR